MLENEAGEKESLPKDVVFVLIGSDADLTMLKSLCVRTEAGKSGEVPVYDVDFAGEIGKQAFRAGVGSFLDCGLNTASDLQQNYSYRRELGKTGRMMALIVRDFLP